MLAAGVAMGLTITAVMQLGMSGLTRTLAGTGAGAIHTMQQICMAASIALSFAVYGQTLETRSELGAASAMMWLQIGSTGTAALLALGLLGQHAIHRGKAKA
ncbi:MFS transporter permease [Tabrizicola sp.]|uniref:MFS transporter permease n=1 Tax=Tabrizicola sp. TaxID=2005166 RepID=UPI0035B40191